MLKLTLLKKVTECRLLLNVGSTLVSDLSNILGVGRRKRDTQCETACAAVPELYKETCKFDCVETGDENVNIIS